MEIPLPMAYGDCAITPIAREPSTMLPSCPQASKPAGSSYDPTGEENERMDATGTHAMWLVYI